MSLLFFFFCEYVNCITYVNLNLWVFLHNYNNVMPFIDINILISFGRQLLFSTCCYWLQILQMGKIVENEILLIFRNLRNQLGWNWQCTEQWNLGSFDTLYFILWLILCWVCLHNVISIVDDIYLFWLWYSFTRLHSRTCAWQKYYTGNTSPTKCSWRFEAMLWLLS